MNKDAASNPFFTIGVTTYNRTALLKQTLRSIVSQTFTDFEVIVGNDYVQEPLSSEILGISDKRIRFVNYSENLGEVGNNNALLGLGRGRYFTWQTDDDLFAPNFLEEVHSALENLNFPLCTFTSFGFIHGTSFPDPVKTSPGQRRSLSGREFLRMYWSGKIKALGCTGVYDREYLTRLGGVESLSDTTFALYSEHLLLIQAGLLDRVAYVDEPLVQFRIHEGSWGTTRKEPSLSKQAGENFVGQSLKVLSNPELRNDFQENIASVLLLVVRDVLNRLSKAQGRCASPFEVLPYLFSLEKHFHLLKGSVLYWQALYSLCRVGLFVIWKNIFADNTRALLVQPLVKFGHALGLPMRRRS
jgi:hypothetical protein